MNQVGGGESCGGLGVARGIDHGDGDGAGGDGDDAGGDGDGASGDGDDAGGDGDVGDGDNADDDELDQLAEPAKAPVRPAVVDRASGTARRAPRGELRYASLPTMTTTTSGETAATAGILATASTADIADIADTDAAPADARLVRVPPTWQWGPKPQRLRRPPPPALANLPLPPPPPLSDDEVWSRLASFAEEKGPLHGLAPFDKVGHHGLVDATAFRAALESIGISHVDDDVLGRVMKRANQPGESSCVPCCIGVCRGGEITHERITLGSGNSDRYCDGAA
jgi:hypothetical protein